MKLIAQASIFCLISQFSAVVVDREAICPWSNLKPLASFEQVSDYASCAYICKRDPLCTVFTHNLSSQECLTSSRRDAWSHGNCTSGSIKERIDAKLKRHEALSPAILSDLLVFYNFKASFNNLVNKDLYKATPSANTQIDDKGVKIKMEVDSYIDIDTMNGAMFDGKFPADTDFTFLLKIGGSPPGSSIYQIFLAIYNCSSGENLFQLYKAYAKDKLYAFVNNAGKEWKYFRELSPLTGEYEEPVLIKTTFQPLDYAKLTFSVKNSTSETAGSLTSAITDMNIASSNNNCMRVGYNGLFDGYAKCLAVVKRGITIEEFREIDTAC